MMMWNTDMTQRSGSMIRTLALAIASLSIGAHALSISGTVKSSAGAALSGVTVTVKDSSNYAATTDANGKFSFQTVEIHSSSTKVSAFSVHLNGRDLTVRSPVDGTLRLALVDGSGRSVWAAEVVASNGIASTSLPTSLRSGAIFLRIRHAGGIAYQAVTIGPDGLQVAQGGAAGRASAAYPTLLFKKTGYNDTSYTMTSETATGITVTMSVPTVCDLPTTFKWKDYGKPVASAKNGWVSIKDFTHVLYNGMHYVHMTYYTTGWNSATMAPFANWADADAAKQTSSNTGVAPELMYFSPKKVWINSKQWCSGGSFCWMEASDVSKPSTFALKGNLLTETITDNKAAPIDQTMICDDNNCYIFYADDNGRIYRGSMPKANFPGTFTGTKKILEDTQTKMFEAVEVYKLKGQKKYLMIVECAWTRYFRAFTATDLGGTWTPLGNTREEATPFAGAKNVTGGWSNDISHGDLIRSSYDEYREVDPCNLQLLYQGFKSPFTGDYGLAPYQMGLLTLQR
jgi:Glycosyl hydrolase family 62/Carboxypeptidase regulatory-like domain